MNYILRNEVRVNKGKIYYNENDLKGKRTHFELSRVQITKGEITENII